jgi:TPP-dependent 2-oxoacid decarboxylase
VPIKPQRVYEEMNKAFGRDTVYVTTIGLSRIAGAQFLHVFEPRQWINCGQAGPLGWTLPAALGVVANDTTRTVVGLFGTEPAMLAVRVVGCASRPSRGALATKMAPALAAAGLNPHPRRRASTARRRSPF